MEIRSLQTKQDLNFYDLNSVFHFMVRVAFFEKSNFFQIS